MLNPARRARVMKFRKDIVLTGDEFDLEERYPGIPVSLFLLKLERDIVILDLICGNYLNSPPYPATLISCFISSNDGVMSFFC